MESSGATSREAYLCQSNSPPSTFLSLRAVSRQFNRVASPHAWNTVDLQVSDWDYSAPPSRDSIGALEFFASHPEITSLIRTLCIRRGTHLRDTHNDLELLRASRSLEGLLRSISSLISLYKSLLPLSDSTLQLLYSQPSLRLLADCFPSGNARPPPRVVDLNACQLEALWTGASNSTFDFLCRQRQIKYLMLKVYGSLGVNDNNIALGHLDSSWLARIEELATY